MKLLCLLPAVPCRTSPSDKSEMSTQFLYGESATILDENEKWFLVKSDSDGYESWVDKKQMVSISEGDFKELKQNAHVRQSAVFDLAPNHRSLFIPFGSLVESEKDKNSENAAPKKEALRTKLTNHAFQLLGCPYLWGGRTPMGYDCSGFVQAIFMVNGISLPRDAKQQAEVGEAISFIEEAQNCDLAFFDNEKGSITHVGMLIHNESNGDMEIIHASGCVRVDKFDHQGIFNSETGQYTHSLRLIRRVLHLNC